MTGIERGEKPAKLLEDILADASTTHLPALHRVWANRKRLSSSRSRDAAIAAMAIAVAIRPIAETHQSKVSGPTRRQGQSLEPSGSAFAEPRSSGPNEGHWFQRTWSPAPKMAWPKT